MKKVCLLALALSPLMLAVLPLSWLASPAGVEWAYSLSNTNQLINFGGNAAEVYSHLLNWIVMTGSVGALGTAWAAAFKARTDAGPDSGRGFLPLAIFLFTVSVLLVWAGCLDGRSGEGTVVMSFILFFGPSLALLFVAARRLWDCGGNFKAPLLAIVGLFVVSVVFQWFYQLSETGGPNRLVVPLLLAQVGSFWFVVAALRRRRLAKSREM